MSQVEKAETVVAELRARRESLVARGHSLAQRLPQWAEKLENDIAQARRERKRGRVMSSIPTPGIHRGGCIIGIGTAARLNVRRVRRSQN
jgi:hypothetical protein